MTRIVLHAFNAYVGSVSGATTCAFWADDPSRPPINWNAALLNTVDLSRTPAAARAGTITWTDVDVDDHVTAGGFTTIGPLFPGGAMIGSCWLSDQYLSKCAKPPGRPLHAHDYELRAIVYDGDATHGNRRFQGFHAKILNTQTLTTGGTIALVQLWTAGTGRSSGPMGTWWLDLDAIAHPIAPDATQVGPGSAPRDGALFLDVAMRSTYTAAGGGTGPKLPPSFGLDF